MYIISLSKNVKFKFLIFLFFNICILNNDNTSHGLETIHFLELKKNLKISSFYDLLNISIEKKSILIFEPNDFHHECLPGYSKYFIDLGFKVDILMKYNAIDTFSLFKKIDKLRIFTFNSLNEIYITSKNLSSIIKNYNYVLIQTYFYTTKDLYKDLELLNNNNSIFVSHDIRPEIMNHSNYLKQNRLWTLGNFSRGLYVNPHYFGDIKITNKNKKVRFFLTSTIFRNYSYFVDAFENLNNETLNFEIFVTGRTNFFNINNISKNLNDKIIFKYQTSYFELFQLIYKSDYIFIPLEPNNKYDIDYKDKKSTGSMQLVYGFLKPAIINEEFANSYNLDNSNSLIYNNTNLFNIIKRAIQLKNRDYLKLRRNLKITEKYIYEKSINNILKIIN